MAASDSENTEENKSSSTNRVVVIVIPILAAMAVILILLLLYAFRKRKLKRKGTVRLKPDGEATNRIGKNELDLPLFTFMQIAKATNDFSSNNKLGEGGFGPVYKVADSPEKGTEHEDEYMISKKELLVNRFISVPKDIPYVRQREQFGTPLISST